MASEYLKWKARDVQRETPRELTPQEKRKNWWHYHKWYVFLGMVLLAILCDIGWHVLRTAKPDYQVAYVGTDALPEDTVAALEAGFAALGEDLNGDGRVTVRLVQYASSGGADAGAAYSAEVQLMSDLLDCESFFSCWRIRIGSSSTTTASAAWTAPCRKRTITLPRGRISPGISARFLPGWSWANIPIR